MKGISLLALFILAVSSVFAIPSIYSYVTDSAGILSSETRSTLETYLREVDGQYNIQFVIVIENQYDKSYTLEEYTLKIAEENGVGSAKEDSGLLFYLAIDDREFRWETGYGTEGILNAALLGRISREVMVPHFQEGNYELGILTGVEAVGSIIENDDSGFIAQEKTPSADYLFWIFLAIFILIIIAVIVNARKHKGRWNNDVYRGAGSGLFMGGFGRGGSGGFGGFSGGGGSFGGGGFSGKW